MQITDLKMALYTPSATLTTFAVDFKQNLLFVIIQAILSSATLFLRFIQVTDTN